MATLGPHGRAAGPVPAGEGLGPLRHFTAQLGGLEHGGRPPNLSTCRTSQVVSATGCSTTTLPSG